MSKLETSAQLLSQFLQWWAAEVHSCVHDLLLLFAPQRRRILNAYWDGTRLAFVDEGSQEPQMIAEIPAVDGTGRLPESLPTALAVVREQNRRVRLYISSKMAYVRQFRLPYAALPHLEAAVALQLPKLLPVEATELLVDFEVTVSDLSQKMASIDLAALKKVQWMAVRKTLKQWGLQIVSTHLGNLPERKHRFRFGRDAAHGYRFQLDRRDKVLAGAAAALGFACVSVAATESYRGQVSLEHAKTEIGIPAGAALGQRQELLGRLEPLKALSQLEAAPSTAALLADLTMLVPQNTWLTTMELKDSRIRIVGLSPNAANVVKLMSSSTVLNDVVLRSSMSLGIGTGLDRFELTAELKASSP
jgi:hypothetical protein